MNTYSLPISYSRQKKNERKVEEMEEGKVTIGIDYYTQLVSENADMKGKIKALQNMVSAEKTSILYVKDVCAVIGLERKEG